MEELWYQIKDKFYSNPNVRGLGWVSIALLYISLLMIFTHVDLIISSINCKPNETFSSLAIEKHSNLISLLVNIGLLIFLVIDLIIAFDKRMSLLTVSIINLVGVASCVFMLIFSLGCHEAAMKKYGAISWEPGLWICWIIFLSLSSF